MCAIVLAVPEKYRAGARTQVIKSTQLLASGSLNGAIQSSTGNGEEPGRPGRKADVDANRSIANVVGAFGNDWRTRLSEICQDLDDRKVPLPTSAKWTQKGCGDWTDVLAEDQEGLVKALKYRLDWVAKNAFDETDLPRGE